METIKAKVIMLPTDSVNQVKEGELFINDSRKHSWGKLEALKCERITQHMIFLLMAEILQSGLKKTYK
jgi:hypothetical protein